jgi:hypothetical protein
MAPRRAFLAASLLLGHGFLQACANTPTLPLPPPVATAEFPDESGLVRVSGTALGNAFVSVLNTRTEQGVITRADDDGAFATDIAASAGDRLELWQEADGEIGERIDLAVPPR